MVCRRVCAAMRAAAPPGLEGRICQKAAARKCRLCGTQSVLALTKHTPGRRKDRRSQIYHQIRYHIQKVSSAYLQLEISMVFGVPLRTEHISLTYPQLWLKSCLNIVEYRLGKYQDMHWPVGAPALPYARLLITSGAGDEIKYRMRL